MAGQPVTLITGASAGIGAALARVFAERGHSLVLIANRSAQLDAVADQIAAAGAMRPHVLPLDLLRADAATRIEHELRERGLEAQYIVNSAGFGLLGRAAGLDRAEQLAMIDLNMRVLTDLSLRFLAGLERHRGGVLNVASVLGFLPGPGMAVYHATKAYVISFSQALHHELAPRGVRVTALCPGPVDTEFTVRADGFFSRRLTRSVERVAREGYAGLMQGRRLVVPGRANKILSVLPRLLPRRYVLSMVGASKRRMHRTDAK
ncbi:MAG TPA: SDR family oxidoreductase [Xanthobacteraceae bacterium]|nr:SDR family oxidoreductase [Xanthobacteraceae bacterium]